MLEERDSSYCWIFEFFGIWVTYNFILYPKTIAENSYKYNFYDTVEKTKKKKNRDCKIYPPFSHYKGNGFKFKRIIGPKKRTRFRLVFLMTTKKLRQHLYIIIQVYGTIQIFFIETEIIYL